MKLVRDKIQERHPQHEYRQAERVEIPSLLRLKLMEEAGEVISARNQAELLEELADLAEVVKTLAERHGIRLEDVEAMRSAKRCRLGGFDSATVMVEYRKVAS